MSAWPNTTLPASRVPDPLDAPALRWGILGTGWIAERFVSALMSSTRQQVAAVGSRSSASAQDFARRLGIAKAYGTYEDLVSAADIDIIYVASPHHLHFRHGLLAIEAGKHVLIEKPIALSLADLDRLFTAADAHQVMCQEAFWSFFLPKFDVIRQVLDDGLLGCITTVLADHGECLPPPHRIHDPEMAGGSLHDLGVYTFAISAWAAGTPIQTRAVGTMTQTGVAGDVAISLLTESGAVSSLSTTMFTTTPCHAVIAGTEATLATTDAFFFPGPFVVTNHASGSQLTWQEPNTRHGALYFEAAEVARCINAGVLSTPVWTRQNSRDVARTLDAVNADLAIGSISNM